MSLESFILAFILWMDPLMKHVNEEDPAVRLERLKAIAADISTVCNDQKEKPVFEGKDARLKTCMLLASIAYSESGFKESVDSGLERGDGGRSVCIMQVQHGQNDVSHPPLEKLKDRKTCIRAGLNVLRSSKCNNGSDVNQMLRGYVSGSCEPFDNPKKDAVVLKTAASDAAGYSGFIRSHKVLPKVKMDVDENKLSDSSIYAPNWTNFNLVPMGYKPIVIKLND